MIGDPDPAGDRVVHVELHPLALLPSRLWRLSRKGYIRRGGGSNGRVRARRLRRYGPTTNPPVRRRIRDFSLADEREVKIDAKTV